MFDTHCHLNFKAFVSRIDEIIKEAKQVGVENIVVPGSDVISSQKAVKIAEKYDGIYAAVGVHPYHIYQYQRDSTTQFFSHENLTPTYVGVPSKVKKITFISSLNKDLINIEKLLTHKKVVAVGEVGIDRYYYRNSKYSKYHVSPELVELQKLALIKQLKLASKYNKSIILHNRQATEELLQILSDYRQLITEYRCVFHCCEPDEKLLEFAKKNHIYIGVDGDVTYRKSKQEFVKRIPLELLVLETDSPYLLPRLHQGFGGQAEPLRTQKKFPNEPKNLPIITKFVAGLIKIPLKELVNQTTKNAKNLFNINTSII